MPKKVLIALPERLLAAADAVAQAECRTRSDLMREALRRYIDAYNDRRPASALQLTAADFAREVGATGL